MALKRRSPTFAPGGEISSKRPIVLVIPLGRIRRARRTRFPVRSHFTDRRLGPRDHLRVRLRDREAVPRVDVELGSGYAGSAPGHHQHAEQQEQVDHLLGSP